MLLPSALTSRRPPGLRLGVILWIVSQLRKATLRSFTRRFALWDLEHEADRHCSWLLSILLPLYVANTSSLTYPPTPTQFVCCLHASLPLNPFHPYFCNVFLQPPPRPPAP